MHTYVYCSTIHSSKDLEPTQRPTNDVLDKENVTHICTTECYVVMIKNEFMSFAGTWMKLETIILTQLTQEQKSKPHVLTHKWEVINENTWAQGQEYHTPGPTGE